MHDGHKAEQGQSFLPTLTSNRFHPLHLHNPLSLRPPSTLFWNAPSGLELDSLQSTSPQPPESCQSPAWTLPICHSLSCVPLKFTDWSSNTQCDCTGGRAFKEVIKIKWSYKGGALIQQVWCQRATAPFVQAQREDHVRTEREGSHLQVRERGLTRTQPCRHLDHGLPAFADVRK